MKVSIEISDRELLDLDLAITTRKIELTKDLRKLNKKLVELLHNSANEDEYNSIFKQKNKINEEINSLNSVLDKIYNSISV